MPASLRPSAAHRRPRVFRSSALSILALAGALACGEDPAPTGPDFAKMAVPLTATPSSLDFASPAATPQTLTATVQYTGLITATSASCATVSPVSVPAAKPAGSSVYLARFTVTPTAVGICTLTLTDKKGVRVSVPVNVGAAGAMFFVAHEDDDLLFLNPDIDAAFADGKYVTTVYLTAGSCTGDVGAGAYYRTREAGVQEAYARLAGVANAWTLTSQPIRELTLTAQPRISLVFFRLPASKSEAGNICDLSTTNLRGLWKDGVTTPTLAMTSLDSAHSYTRSQLIAALTGLIRRWHPVSIETLDASGLFGQEDDDPSGRQIAYPTLGGRCYYYDHSDHFYSAKFTRVASDAYSDAHTLARHRGYNQANEAANVTGTDLTTKEDVFQAYAGHDAFISGPPYAGLYQPWLERQYDADDSPAPVQTLCGLLAFAQAASSSATSGQPLAQQPIVQLQDADGTDVAVGGVQVTAAVIDPASNFTALSTVATDGNGRATFAGLTITGAAGQYFLDFTAPGYVETAVPVDVAAGP